MERTRILVIISPLSREESVTRTDRLIENATLIKNSYKLLTIKAVQKKKKKKRQLFNYFPLFTNLCFSKTNKKVLQTKPHRWYTGTT